MITKIHRLSNGQAIGQLVTNVECGEECTICKTVKAYGMKMSTEPQEVSNKIVYNPPTLG